MRPPHQFRHTPRAVRCPIGSSTEGPIGRVRMAAPPHFGTPLGLWPHRPIGCSTEGPGGRVRMAAPPHVGAPITRFVAR
eukprot:5332263-Pyramimonas_sp.AAC.1